MAAAASAAGSPGTGGTSAASDPSCGTARANAAAARRSAAASTVAAGPGAHRDQGRAVRHRHRERLADLGREPGPDQRPAVAVQLPGTSPSVVTGIATASTADSSASVATVRTAGIRRVDGTTSKT